MAKTAKTTGTRMDISFAESVHSALLDLDHPVEQKQTSGKAEPAVKKEAVKEEPVRPVSVDTDLDTVFRRTKKKNRGVSRTIYFEDDVFRGIEAIAEHYEISLSPAVNILLRRVLQEMNV